MTADSDLRWGLAQRFEFIEWRAYWRGRVNRKDLEDEFNISTPQASLDFRRYQEAAPGNIEYDATEKTYVAAAGFRPKFFTLSPERYLLQLQALRSGAIKATDTWFDVVPPADISPAIARGPEAYTLRAIVRAIEMRGSIEINYQSLTRIGVRRVCPHSLVTDGYRWHVRALSVEHQEYRDYVLGRILSVSEPKACETNHEDDVEWHTIVRLALVAHPGLKPEEKATVEHDFRMQNGELDVEMRAALAFYFIKRHNLDLRDGQVAPQRVQLFLENYDEIAGQVSRAKKASRERIASRVKIVKI